MSYPQSLQRSMELQSLRDSKVKIEGLEKQWDLKDGAVFRAVVTKQPRYGSWPVPSDVPGKREWRNDIDALDARTEAEILRYMKFVMRNRARGMILVDITEFPMIQCTFEEEYDPYSYNPALSQPSVPFTLVNRGISLHSTRHFAL